MQTRLVAGLASVVSVAAIQAQPVTLDIVRQGGSIESLNYEDNEAIILNNISNLDDVILIRVYSTNPDNSASIGAIQLSGTRSSAAPLDVLIGRGSAITDLPGSPLPDAATDWGGIQALGGLVDKVRVSGAILRDLTGPIDVGAIVRLQCGGRIRAAIEVSSPGMALERLVVPTIAPGISVSALHGDIGTLEFTGVGQVLNVGGDISAPEGSIGAVLAPGWIGGLEGANATVRARDGISTLEAFVLEQGSVIEANAFGGTGSISRLQAFALRGEVHAQDLLPDSQSPEAAVSELIEAGLLHFAGNVYQNIKIQTAEGSTADGRIHIDGNLHSSLTCLTSIGEIIVLGEVRRLAGSPPISISVWDEGGVIPHEIDVLHLGDVVDTALADSIYDVTVLTNTVWDCSMGNFHGDLETELIFAEITGDAGGRIIGISGQIDVRGQFGHPQAPPFYDMVLLGPEAGMRIGGDFYGTIEVDTEFGLAGQITIGAAPPLSGEGNWWYGTIRRAQPAPVVYDIGPSRPQPDAAPYYERPVADIGGGAIGLVPFNLHAAACQPPLNNTQPPEILASEFSHVGSSFAGALDPAEVVLEFYGPVRTDSLTDHPIRLTREVPGSPEAPEEAFDVVVRRGTTGDLSRTVRVHGNGVMLTPGTYHIRPVLDPEEYGRLQCDNTFWPVAPSVHDFTYTFVLLPDCNRNGWRDDEELIAEPYKDLWPPDGTIDSCQANCEPDINCDGAVNGFDIGTMEAIVNGDYSDFCWPPEAADFNHDGALNGFDTADVEAAVNGSPCP